MQGALAMERETLERAMESKGAPEQAAASSYEANGSAAANVEHNADDLECDVVRYSSWSVPAFFSVRICALADLT